MKMSSILFLISLCVWIVSVTCSAEATQEIPEDFNVVTQTKTLSEREMALEAIYKLNQDKSEIYQRNLGIFKKNLLDNSPVILALFSSQGGKFILYRPHQEPIIAASVSKEYEIVKSIGHSTLALYSYVVPFLSNNKNSNWKTSIESFLIDNKKALSSIDLLDISSELKNTMKKMIQKNIQFMETVLKTGKLSLDLVRTYTSDQLPDIRTLLTRATALQVGHWIDVLNEWKDLLGQDFKKTYAVVSSVYVTRSRNVLYTVLAQFFREEAFNDRLILFETTDFGISPDAVLGELTRVVSDRSIGKLFFGGKFEMDVELLGEASRQALKENENKLPGPLLLPPLRPANDTRRWPW